MIVNNFVIWNKTDKISKKIKYIFFILCFYLFIFQFALQEYIPILQYWDEFYAILFFPLILIKVFEKRRKKEKVEVRKEDKIILLLAVLIILLGVLGNIIFMYQNIFIAVQEILIVFKFLLAFYTSKMIFEDLNIYHNEKIANHTKLITIFLFILIILDYIFGFFPQQIRYGLKTEQLFFGHQTGLAAVMIVNLSILMYTSKSKFKMLYVILNLFIISSTLRAKALAIVVIFIILYYWLVKKNRKISIKLIMVILIVSVVIAAQQISYYFIEVPNTARSVLIKTSFQIATDHFPLGSGFATFGTHLSGENYSPIYEIYQIENTYGISEDNPKFISDNFWPAIVGEFGYIGFLLYIGILLIIYKKIHKKYNINRNVYIAALLPFLYLLVASTAESAFLHTMSVAMFFAISIILNTESTTNIKKNYKNIILIDFPKKENWEFKQVLEKETNLEWNEVETVSNQRRKNVFSTICRYFKYFTLPLSIFIDRKKYEKIIAWQQFYGLLYAFYCRILHSKKYNKLIIMTFIYKAKKGLIGKIYYKFMKFIVQSKYIDVFICFSKKECKDYAKIFNVKEEKFQFCTLGLESIEIDKDKIKQRDYILSCGRSNRDYEFLYNALKDTDYKLKILSDECKLKNEKNIEIYNNIFNEEYYKMLEESYIVVIPLMDENISSGQLAILQAMQLGKPIICTKSSTVTDYIKNGINGFIVKKEKNELLEKIQELYNNKELYTEISKNEKEFFKENFSINSLGKQISKIIIDKEKKF